MCNNLCYIIYSRTNGKSYARKYFYDALALPQAGIYIRGRIPETNSRFDRRVPLATYCHAKVARTGTLPAAAVPAFQPDIHERNPRTRYSCSLRSRRIRVPRRRAFVAWRAANARRNGCGAAGRRRPAAGIVVCPSFNSSRAGPSFGRKPDPYSKKLMPSPISGSNTAEPEETVALETARDQSIPLALLSR